MTDAHLALRTGFHVSGKTWCGHVLNGRDKVYMTPGQLRRQPNACATCLARYDAKAKPHHTLDGRPIGGRHVR